MENKAIREVKHIKDRQVVLSVPDWLEGKDVEVIMIPCESNETRSSTEQTRLPNIFRGRGQVEMSNDFDDELPDSFWSGE